MTAQTLLWGIGGILGATVAESFFAPPAVAQTILDYRGLPTNPDGSVNKPAVQAIIAGGSTTLRANGSAFPITTALPGSTNPGTSYLTTVRGVIDPLRTSQYNRVVPFENPEGEDNLTSSLYSPFLLEHPQDRFIRSTGVNPPSISDVPNGIDSVFKTFGQNGPTVTVVPEVGTFALALPALGMISTAFASKHSVVLRRHKK